MHITDFKFRKMRMSDSNSWRTNYRGYVKSIKEYTFMTTPQQRKVALVTGGSGGIGSEIARRLASEAMAIIIIYCHAEAAAQQVVQDIRQAGGEAAMVRADLSKPAEVHAAFEAAIATFGGVDVVINTAGVIIPGAIADVSEATYDAVFDVNVRGALMMMK